MRPAIIGQVAPVCPAETVRCHLDVGPVTMLGCAAHSSRSKHSAPGEPERSTWLRCDSGRLCHQPQLIEVREAARCGLLGLAGSDDGVLRLAGLCES